MDELTAPNTIRNRILVGATMREEPQVRRKPSIEDSGYGSMIASKRSSMSIDYLRIRYMISDNQ